MRSLAALVLIVVLLVGIAAPADACGAACGVAIGLASFFTLTALLAPLTYAYPYPAYPAYAYAAPVTYQTPVVDTTRPVVYQSPVYQQPPVVQSAPAAPTRVVQYPHGRYELRGDGVTTAYHWVWVAFESPIPPPPAGLPPAAPPPGPTQ
jgi:hypothetical protein